MNDLETLYYEINKRDAKIKNLVEENRNINKFNDGIKVELHKAKEELDKKANTIEVLKEKIVR